MQAGTHYNCRTAFRSSSKVENGQQLILTGILTKSVGIEGPFPAVVAVVHRPCSRK